MYSDILTTLAIIGISVGMVALVAIEVFYFVSNTF